MAEKKGVTKTGWGLASNFEGNAAAEAGRIGGKALNGSKAFRTARRLDRGGTALALAGGGLLAANAIKNRKNKKEGK